VKVKAVYGISEEPMSAEPVGSPWRGPSPSGNPKTARQRIGYAATREAAMSAFAKAGGGNRPRTH
jgi:hypothetical protein